MAEAFTVLEEEPIKLILTSKELDKESGEDFILQLNESRHKEIPVIVITSEDSLKVRQRFFSLGVADYILKKHLSSERLSACIDELTRQDNLNTEMLRLNYAILDDSNVSRDIIASTLAAQGIKQVTLFSAPQDLLAYDGDFEVYFIDMVMPGMSGEEVIRNLRRKNKKAVIITISSISNLKTISQVLNVGANDYVPKPFSSDVFLERLKANIRTYTLLNVLEEKNRELERLSITDGLTKVFNHRHILQILTAEIEQRLIKKSDLSILLIDIDFFKTINDRYGHLVGDEVLVALAQVFLTVIPEDSFFGRYGGEEFLLVMPGRNRDKAVLISQAISSAVAQYSFPGVPEGVTFSGGIVEWDNEEDSGSIIRKADDLLYRAKEEGRNRILS